MNLNLMWLFNNASGMRGYTLNSLLGVALGGVAALALGGVLANLVYGVSTRDLSTFVAVSALLIVVALAATVLPAYRATGMEPSQVLREE